MSANITAALAEPILSLPFHITGVDTRPNPPDMTDPAPSCGDLDSPAWYRYTASASDVAIGISTNPNYFPMVAVYSGAPGSLTEIDCTSGFQPSTLYVRTEPGVTYYIVVCDSDGDGGGDLVLDVTLPPCETVPAGSFGMGQDGLMWFISSVDGTLLQMQQLEYETSGGNVDVLSNGPFLFRLTDFPGFLGELRAPSGSLVADDIITLTNPANGDGGPFRSTVGADPFYFVDPQFSTPNYTNVVKTINQLGVVGGTDWTLPTPAFTSVQCSAVNTAETILYYVGNSLSSTPSVITGTVARTVKRYDLTNDLPLSDLVVIPPAPGGGDSYAYQILDLLVTEDDTILVACKWSGVLATPEVDGVVFEYSAAGALLNTYNVVDNTGPTFRRPQIDLARSRQTGTFWVTVRPNTDNDSTVRTFQQWVRGAGTIAAEFEVSLANRDGPFLIPPFGGFFVTQVQIDACGGPEPPEEEFVDVPIRMERISPTMSQDGNRIFYGRLQLDMQVGVGNADDPNPTVQLQVSNDGGQTWGVTRSVSAGRVGQYLARVKFERNGSARNRVWKIWTDSATVNEMTQAWLDAEEGTS